MRAAPTVARENPDQPAVRALLGALDRYLASLYPPEANHLLDVAALQERGVAFFVARDAAGAPVGTAACVVRDGEPASGGRRYGEVKRMYVAPAARGTGVGTRLLAALEAALCEDGVALAMLETGRDQPEALALYRRSGYAPCAPFAGYADNGLSVFLSKALA